VSALDEHLRARGVAMMALAPGVATPLHFGDPVAEHHATRRACGLFDFSFMACVKIRGAQNLAFLHRLQTRNLTRLARGRIAYTLLLREDGTVLNDATIWCFDENHHALFVGRRADMAHVRRVARDFEVTLADRANDHAVIAVQGPRARAVLGRVVADAPAELPYFGFWSASFRGAPCWLVRIGYSGETGYEIVIGAAHAPAVWEALRAAGAVACGFNALNTLRVEAGHLLFSAELTRPATPAELGLSRLVNPYSIDFMDKCSLRLTPRQRLVGLFMDRRADATDTQSLIGDYPNVRLTSACHSPTLNRVIALGYVAADDAAPGTRLRLAPGLCATVARLPFYDPGRFLARHTH
jgi:aminomethyltransferase